MTKLLDYDIYIKPAGVRPDGMDLGYYVTIYTLRDDASPISEEKGPFRSAEEGHLYMRNYIINLYLSQGRDG